MACCSALCSPKFLLRLSTFFLYNSQPILLPFKQCGSHDGLPIPPTMNLWTDDDTSLMEAFMSLSDMALFWAASSSQPTTQPTHAPLQPQSSASTSDYPKAPVATQFQLSAMPFNQETLMQSLQALIEGARESWTYAIFWQSSYDYSSADAVLGWGEGFYKDERDKVKANTSLIRPLHLFRHSYSQHPVLHRRLHLIKLCVSP
ncbi:hypothetical protein TB2_002730 [Malus domestica]